MATDYRKRLAIPEGGDLSMTLFCSGGNALAQGYTRVVIGRRGPYVELSPEQVLWEEFVPASDSHYYYDELRSRKSHVKLYAQLQAVDYADYVPGMCYVSPFDLQFLGLEIVGALYKIPCISRIP